MNTPITLEDDKATCQVTVLKSTGEIQRGVYAKIFGSFNEFEADENGIISIEYVNSGFSHTAKLYFRNGDSDYSKSFEIKTDQNTQTVYFDSQSDIINYKRTARLFPIEGIVIDENGNPIERATVSIQGTGRRTLTDEIGLFNIEADFNHSIVIRADGMDNLSYPITHFLQGDSDNTIILRKKNSYEIYSSVENMPEFPGGMKAFQQYLNKNLEYPSKALKAKIEGVVVVQFVVEKNGEITDPRIARRLETSLDTAALKVIKNMPNWIPASDYGTKVRCKYSVPVAFKIPEAKPVLPIDSMKITKDSLSFRKDSLMLSPDSLTMDSLKQADAINKGLRPDSLKSDSISKVLIPIDSLQQDSTRIFTDKNHPVVKAKKRNAFVRFFRWLFGIERRQRKKAEKAELLQAQTDSLRLKTDSLRLKTDSLNIGNGTVIKLDSSAIQINTDSLKIDVKEVKEKMKKLAKETNNVIEKK